MVEVQTEKDWSLSSNTELEQECKRLETIYKEKQEILKIIFDDMETLSKEYNRVSDVLEGRGVTLTAQ